MIPTQGSEKAREVVCSAIKLMSDCVEGAGLNELGQDRAWREEHTRLDKDPIDVLYDCANIIRAAESRLRELGYGK